MLDMPNVGRHPATTYLIQLHKYNSCSVYLTHILHLVSKHEICVNYLYDDVFDSRPTMT